MHNLIADSIGLECPVNPVTSRCPWRDDDYFIGFTPVWLDGCLGWLHSDANAVGDLAVLICMPVSWDALRSHHALRQMADAFAAAGYPTLRFHYPGTADSIDLPADAEPWAAWQRSIHVAADWLRSVTAAKRIVLVGLRLGATLAALVSEQRDDVGGLVLLSPVLRGHSYIRQLLVEMQIEAGHEPSAKGELDLFELRLNAETVRRIRAVDLRQAVFPPRLNVALFHRLGSRLAGSCARQWATAGAAVTHLSFEPLQPMLLSTAEPDPPPVDLSTVLAWLRQAFPIGAIRCQLVVPHAKPLELPGLTETPLRFGHAQRLVGILCRPNGPARDEAVLILNTGRDPRYGLGRFGVSLARQLAEQGFTSLRFDFAGLGDSLRPQGEDDTLSDAFTTDRSADIAAALEVLEQDGHSRFAVQGLCAGAYHALHAALADERIATVLLINLPAFQHEAVAIRFEFKRRVTRLMRVETWAPVWQGETSSGRIVRDRAEAIWKKMTRLYGRPYSGSTDSFARWCMTTLARRSARVLLLFSPDDPALHDVERIFGRPKHPITALPGVELHKVELHKVPGIRHNLATKAMHQSVSDLIIGFLMRGGSTRAR